MSPHQLCRLAAAGAIAWVTACGGAPGDSTGGSDASPGTSDASAAMPDAAETGPVDVIVTGWPHRANVPLYRTEDVPILVGWPALADQPDYVAGVPVVVFDPDGGVMSMHQTDANGRVTATVQRGSLVAVVYGDRDTDVTFVNVDAAFASPGDTLRFGPELPSLQPIGRLDVTWPARVIPNYTVYYHVITPCGVVNTTSLSASIPLYQGCAAGPLDVVVTSQRSSQEVTGILTRRHVQPAATVNVSFASDSWGIATTTMVALENAPNTAQQPATSCTASQFLGTLFLNGLGATALDGACSMRLLPGTETTWDVKAIYMRNGDASFALETRHSFPHDTIGPLDGAGSLPWITSLSYEPATRVVSWTSEQTAPIDASSLRLSAAGRDVTWRVYAPGGLPTSWHVPALPAEHAAYDLGPADVVRARLLHFDIDGFTTSDLLQHSLYYDSATFVGRIVHNAKAASN